jgi:aminotransferase
MLENLALRARGIEQSNIRAVTRRIEAVNGINFGQGTCDLPPHPKVIEAAHRALDEGHNSYTLFDGIMPLKEGIAARYRSYNKLDIGPENVLVTGGATGGLECVCKCFIDPGDEVILFEPIYQYHVRLIQERGAVPRFVRLKPPGWTFDADELRAAVSSKTKLLLFANPNNPCGKVFTREELKTIGDVCGSNGVVAVVDEVYEYILGPDVEHVSLASLPGMFERTLTLSSASKTLFVTGWRVGWVVGPEPVMSPLGVKSDETYVCAPAPLQYAVSDALRLGDDFFDSIRAPFIRRRDKLCAALSAAGLIPNVPAGAYYVLADYSQLGYDDDIEAMNALIDLVGVGSIPGATFLRDGRKKSGMLRFCFAVTDELIDRGCALLSSRPLTKGVRRADS